jgi:hypothetical protein
VPRYSSVIAANERKSALHKAQTNLYWLATEILGYDRLTESFHKPMMDDMDLRTRRRPLVREWCPEIALGGRAYYKNECEIWPRDHYKTTVFIARCIQLVLIYPDVAIAIWHKVEDKAQDAAQEIGNHFLKNDKLRALRREIMPSKQARRFLTASGFTVKRTMFNRHATIYAKGAGATVTGGHCDVGWLDDIIDQDDVDEGQMPKKRAWLGDTVSNIVRTDGGWEWCTMTPWDEHDISEDFEKSDDWDYRRRSALETDGVMDYSGTPVLYDQDVIERKRRNPNLNFPLQLMCDRSVKTEKAWQPKCEQYITLKEAAGAGYVVVLGDTSPRNIGTETNEKSTYRGDGKKDFWSNCVLKLRRRGERREIILLDGARSQNWDYAEGFGDMARLQKRWHANGMGVENKHQQFRDMILDNLRIACRLSGARYNPIELVSTTKGKNARFALLCARAMQDELLICESVPEEYKKAFLAQCREYRALGAGKNSLQYDDEVDVVSYGCDPSLENRYPAVSEEEAWSPFRDPKDYEQENSGTHYVQW